MDTRLLTQLLENYDITSCLIHHRGALVYHYEQFEQASDRLMPVNSCTKSILSALVCIAMGKGLLPSADTLVGEFFPALRHDPDERKHRITLRHLLTMTAGFRWQEFGGIRSFPSMSRTPDWIAYVLQQPMSHMPGTRFVYNSGVSQLLAAILARATACPIAQFAEQHLFGPLGIAQYAWKSDPQGVHTGGFGLEMTAKDLLNFGRLYLQQGMWNGAEIVPPAFVHESVQPAIAASPPERGYYGWHWWVDSAPDAERAEDAGDAARARTHYYYARGFGGQFVFVIPAADAVVVFTRKNQRKGKHVHELFRRLVIEGVILA